ncbi:hypothetical protein GLA29479_1902 [Lysobacter antibioticus]|nr:hypothetical protein GLA29479_1902 [Lysobacter antibioticus]
MPVEAPHGCDIRRRMAESKHAPADQGKAQRGKTMPRLSPAGRSGAGARGHRAEVRRGSDGPNRQGQDWSQAGAHATMAA